MALTRYRENCFGPHARYLANYPMRGRGIVPLPFNIKITPLLSNAWGNKSRSYPRAASIPFNSLTSTARALISFISSALCASSLIDLIPSM